MSLPVSRRLDFSEIPVIDISSLFDPGSDSDTTVSEIKRSCMDVGFFYIENHGVNEELINAVIESGRWLFNQPESIKNDILINQRIRGYLPLYYRSYEGEDRAGTSHQEGFWIGHETESRTDRPLDGANQWPLSKTAEGRALRQSMERYFSALESVAYALQSAFALALDLDKHYFDSVFKKPNSRLKINHYPNQEDEVTETNIGVVPHTDSGAYTILWQDQQGGLEIQSKSGEWVEAPPMENTFVVNIGNIMQYWSNGLFSSTPHRVINRRGSDRFSIPLFVNPDYETTIHPLVSEDENVFESFQYGKYQVDLWRKTFPIAEIP